MKSAKRLKIAFILDGFPRVSETFILNQITGLLDLGHQVDIYAHNTGGIKVHPDVANYRLMERVRYFNQINDPDTNKLKRILKTFWVIVLNFLRSPLIILNALYVSKIRKEAKLRKTLRYLVPFIGRENTYDIIHCHFG